MKKILVIGSTCVDMIVKIDHIPKRCEDVNSEYVDFSLGGMAYNVFNVVKLLGMDAILGCGIGEGRFADIVDKMLHEKGYRPIGKINGMDNGVCMCLVDHTNERSFISQHGAEYRFDESWFKDINFDDVAMIYISGLEIEDVDGDKIVAFLEAHHLKNRVFFAPGPRIKYLPETLLKRIYALNPIIHLNEEELKNLVDEGDINQALSLLYKMTNNRIIVTMGKEGCLLYDGQKISRQKNEKDIVVVDTIGAGDCHAGACLAGIVAGLDHDRILQIANEVGGNIVGHRGSNASKEDVKGLSLR
ncbi:MAG: PfkB family carbohydrate kinase [Erysipelotrichaceae bacterium]|nr:PfkB family carbohydrate kinase [Erysipelotrichaceae bacterium]MDY5251180.1 PfkB family carbohydrate kinase [Erysipelotrichaceae bacterium]